MKILASVCFFRIIINDYYLGSLLNILLLQVFLQSDHEFFSPKVRLFAIFELKIQDAPVCTVLERFR